MNRFIKAFIITTVTAASIAVGAQPNPETVGIEIALKKAYPGTTFKGVRSTPVQGIYEVQMGETIAYVDGTGKYFFFGKLYDMPNQVDLTELRQVEVSKLDISSLPLKDAIKTVKGNGSRTLVVFSDPDCPFCKQLELSIKGMTDVTIYTFLMPLTSIHPDARRKAINAWCAKDQVAAWENLMVKNKAVPDAACDHPVDRNIALGSKLNISGTPTMYSGDGRKRSGAAEAAVIGAWLDAGVKSAQVSSK
jgi:thiol:disulfide interchange protein DsbC